MEFLLNGIIKAFYMIVSGDHEVYKITFTTLKVSLTAITISTFIGIPLGVIIGLTSFRGKKLVLVIINIGMGLPPVVAGLYITMLLWRSGPLGHLGLLYTTEAIIIAQTVVSLPIITGLTAAAFGQIDEKMLLQIKALGATKWQQMLLLLQETRLAIFAAIMAGLGRVLAEVGAAMMVGGNIKGDTRILTTSMVMEVSKGNFDVAIALSLILMTLAFIITFVLTSLQQRKRYG